MEGILEPVAGFIARQHLEAQADKIGRNTPISYWCHLFDECVYSPADFYEFVEQGLKRRQVPDLLVDFVLFHEGNIFSKSRLYHQMRRERIVGQAEAAGGVRTHGRWGSRLRSVAVCRVHSAMPHAR